ncbi:MAG: FAD:protein FMN transferase [Acidimicrobiia bacterium]
MTVRIQQPSVATFTAMGTQCAVVVNGPPDLARRGEARVHELERRWSRFRPTSEISKLNRRADDIVGVSNETFVLVQRAVDAWHATNGAYDPTVLSAMVTLGYDRTFSEVLARSGDGGYADGPAGADGRHSHAGPSQPAPGCDGIVLDRSLRTVRLPPGTGIDPGGIGKGLAADFVAGELMTLGAHGVCVNMGGDVRVEGRSPTGDGWIIGIADPTSPSDLLLTVELEHGAVVTSTTLTRRWHRNGAALHHVLDPHTGTPARSGVLAASVLTAEAWWAEALAKVAIVRGAEAGARQITAVGATGVIVTPDQLYVLDGMAPFLVDPSSLSEKELHP